MTWMYSVIGGVAAFLVLLLVLIVAVRCYFQHRNYYAPEYVFHEYYAPEYVFHEYYAPEYVFHEYYAPEYVFHEYYAPEYVFHEYVYNVCLVETN